MEKDSVLIVDDDQDILTAGKLLLKRQYARVDTCANPGDIAALMEAHRYSAILLDMNFGPGQSSGEEGFFWLKRILGKDPDAVVVLITAHGGIDVAVEAIKLGATDFISKPWQNEKVIATLSASVKLRRSRSEAERLKKTNDTLVQLANASKQPMLGDSPAMRRVHNLIERTAPTDANVLITGENGTGKELAARAIHQLSNRREKVFMSVDLGSVTESLFESELFGHVKGAFTGAARDETGRIITADGGTLFLDEVGNLPLHLQAKLLSVLETRQVVPVGSSAPIDVDVRVVAATNLSRERLANESTFRQDLLFRLNTVEIPLPALRERTEDIPALASYYIEHYATKYHKPVKPLHADALEVLCRYPWPGNIRALRHTIERAVILSESESLSVDDFALDREPQGIALVRDTEQSSAGDESLNLETLEKKAIKEALNRNRYNISHAARELGITRAALYRRMEKHGF